MDLLISDDDEDIVYDEYCVACLSTDTNSLKNLSPTRTNTYSMLIGEHLPDNLTKKVCYSCDGLLKETEDFRFLCSKSLKWLKDRQKDLAKQITSFNTKNNVLNPSEDDIVLIVEENNLENKKVNNYDTNISVSDMFKNLIIPVIVGRNNSDRPNDVKEQVDSKDFVKSSDIENNETILDIKQEKIDEDTDIGDTCTQSDDQTCSNSYNFKNPFLDQIIPVIIGRESNETDFKKVKPNLNNVMVNIVTEETILDIKEEEIEINQKVENEEDIVDTENYNLFNDIFKDKIIPVIIGRNNNDKDNAFAEPKPVDNTTNALDNNKNNDTKEPTNPQSTPVTKNKKTKQLNAKKKQQLNTLKIKHENVIETSPNYFSKKRLIDTVKPNFHIKQLNHEEQRVEFKKRLCSEEYNKSKYKCQQCFKGFSREESYKNHLHKHTERYGNLKCDICELNFINKNAVIKHNKQCHRYVFTCKECKSVTFHMSIAYEHVLWHKGHKYQCKYCDMKFSHKCNLIMHIRVSHPSNQSCQYCGHNFLTEVGLKMHIKLKHFLDKIPEDGPKCDECNITFANTLAYSTHVLKSKRQHKQISKTEHKCDECNRTFANSSAFISHRRYSRKHRKSKTITITTSPINDKVHKAQPLYEKHELIEDDKPRTCEQCGEVLPTVKKYRFHFYKYHKESTITENPHLCHICGKSFEKILTLKQHFRTHDFGKTHKCDKCDLTFTTLYKMDCHKYYHTRTENSDKPDEFACYKCGKIFNYIGNLRRHEIYVHSDVKKEKCDFCDKRFKSKEERNIHQDYVHLKKPYKKRIRNKRVKNDSSSEN